MHTVAETPASTKDAEAERMPHISRLALKAMLAADPEAGDLTVGSGGIRKVRLAGRGKGMSGGYRVLTA
ncbi:hypothetical protein DK419_20655 [Methylobacterium terrae]|uniref:Uncharacterized protein n=1 Tax=Methylobacterium terrae TaxID=2202827 RepID=A0A2U8WSI4_9HYPH|nr:hypothetical protein DK419_20655 [Methylobacterium terrae]